ncbi:uncharacterized protein PRCAT00003593001 [Priceomyces carsonii]|uniref:uncharacterized protein n=1 Tax=Priceomyces carsonii TaxID=28549 RepID=UPI002EDA2EE3|nr:unnamed protein product [Priceomyces carsonii]
MLSYFGFGIYRDIRNRLPFYVSDFKDAWNYRVIPSITYIFFTNVLPAIAFAQDMLDKTDQKYGVNEVLLSSAIAGVVFGLFSGQPLCIVGVTGPISIFSYTVYDLMKPRGTPYFPFMCWIYLWSMLFHFVIALGNMVSFLKIISTFSCDVFGFFICVVYIQKGIQILDKQFTEEGLASGYCSVMISLCMIICGVGSGILGQQLHYFKGSIRKLFSDYGVPASVIFFTGFIHFGGHLKDTHLATLPTTTSFQPTDRGMDRPHGWFIHFWPGKNISVGDVFLAIPFAILLTFLFYFDHNVSSLMCLLKDYPLKKPSAFHWDFFLLGITTGISGLLGLPPPNGLIPQAPLHTDSLVIHDSGGLAVSVVEQRITNTVQGMLTFVLLTKPLLVVLALIPQAILAGLFFIMGITGLNGNIITNKIRYVFMESDYIKNDPSCPKVFKEIDKLENKKWFYIYLVLQLIAFGFEFGITLTKGAVGFPGVLMFFAICAEWIWPLIIPRDELDKLDGEVADEIVTKSLVIIKNPKGKRSPEGEESWRSSDIEMSSIEDI